MGTSVGSSSIGNMAVGPLYAARTYLGSSVGWGGSSPDGSYFTDDAFLNSYRTDTALSNIYTTIGSASLQYYRPVHPRFLPNQGDNISSGYGGNSWGQSRMAFTAQGDANFFTVDAFGFALFPNVTPDSPTFSKTVKARLEYPLGVFYDFLWSGAASKVISGGAANNRSDFLTLPSSVKNGETYWIHWEEVGTVYVMGCSARSLAGDSYGFGTSGMPELGASYSGSSANTPIAAPNMVAAYHSTDRPFIAFIGDSNTVDQSYNRDSFGVTSFPRAIDSIANVYKFSWSGNNAYVIANPGLITRRLTALEPYNCGRVIYILGTNDLYSGRTSSQMIADIDALAYYTRLRGMIPHFATIAPNYSGASAVNEAARLPFNAYIRANSDVYPYGKHFELADVIETSRDSGVWKSGYSLDGGVHIAWSTQSVRDTVLAAVLSFYNSL